MDPFASYAETARKQIRPAPPLLGPIKTRAAAKDRYIEIVSELNAQTDPENLEIYLLGIEREVKQFHAELEWFWAGDGHEFRGLEKEIEWARARVDDGLDFPRWEPVSFEKELGQ